MSFWLYNGERKAFKWCWNWFFSCVTRIPFFLYDYIKDIVHEEFVPDDTLLERICLFSMLVLSLPIWLTLAALATAIGVVVSAISACCIALWSACKGLVDVFLKDLKRCVVLKVKNILDLMLKIEIKNYMILN